MEIEWNRGGLTAARMNGDADTIQAEISFFILTSRTAYAGSFTYQKDFKRKNDLRVSRETYRNKAIEAVEGLVLNELVACLGEEPAVKYFELSIDEIRSLARAILQRNVMEEKWDGQCYYLRARIIGDSANSDAYPAALGQIQGKARALLDARERARAALEEIKKLEGELGGTQTRARVLEAITTKGREPEEAPSSWIREGEKHWKMGDYARAVSAYDTAVAHNSQSGAAFLGRGTAYFRMGEYAKAVRDLNRACELRPSDVTARVNLASALAETGAYERALEALNQALTLDPASFEAYLNRGILHLVHGLDIDSALGDLTEAVRLRPDDYRGYFNRALLYARVGRYEKAIDDYDLSLTQNPDFPLTYFNRANATMHLGGAEKAIEDYTRFIERFAGQVGGYFNRALAYAEIGDYGKALSDFDHVITLEPGRTKALVCRGILHYKMAAMNLAREDWQAASALGDPMAKNYLGEILN